MRRAAPALALASLLGSTPALYADLFVLLDGDRITGKSVSEGKSTFRIQTPYGRLTVPRAKIAKIVRADGHEDVVNAPRADSVPVMSLPSAAPVRLIVVITGKSFFYGWERKDASGADPTLRLQVRLNEDPVATYVDKVAGEEDKRGFVNMFAFIPEEITLVPGPGAAVLAPETRPGRIVLKIGIPAGPPSSRRLRLAYQVNEGPVATPAWRDVVESAIDIQLRSEGPVFVEAHQEAGKMEFSGFGKRRMKNVETFRIDLKGE